MKETTNKSKTRAHHYLSQCYLKGFSASGSQSIIPIDLKNKNILNPSNCINFAHKRDFNRVDLEGIDPNYLEDFLGRELEGQVATSIRNIESTNKFEDQDRIVILNILALFAIRNPTRRLQYNKIVEQGSKLMLSMASQQVGRSVNGIKITEEFKKFVDEDDFQILLPRNEHIQAEFALFSELLPSFFGRKWMLMKAPDDAHFITSDFPVVLIWSDPSIPKDYPGPPGFGLPGTQIHFPLSKKLALIGNFDGIDDTLVVPKETVALINSNILAHAQRWVFTSNQDFYFLDQSGKCLFGIQNYMDYLNEITAS